mgnify:CR=1 FL=1
MSVVANTILIIGGGLQVCALVPVAKLIAQLPPGRIRIYWYGLGALILFFIAGYVGYTALHWNSPSGPANLVVPVIFFFGACFVLAVAGLSLRTALDVRRVAVLELENITDPLMAIHNRRYLERRLKEEVERADRYGLALSLLMIDVDHFKNINDTFGHHAGDHVLVGLGKLIGDVCRDSDIAARYGGEEMVIILPNTDAAGALKFAERLRQMVESASLLPADASKDGQPAPITISIGVAQLDEQVRGVAGILASADKAVYSAKRAGRNRIAVGGPPLS